MHTLLCFIDIVIFQYKTMQCEYNPNYRNQFMYFNHTILVGFKGLVGLNPILLNKVICYCLYYSNIFILSVIFIILL